jgi:hypothetical protein
MPIRDYLENQVFDPDAIAIMSQALDAACAALQIGADDTHERRVVAARIIDLARGGVADANALRDRVLLEAKS